MFLNPHDNSNRIITIIPKKNNRLSGFINS